jgi:hypothetical protein
VALGVQLAEQLPGWISLDGDAQRGGARRPRQPEPLDLLDQDAELVLQAPPDRLPTGAADVQVGGAATPVGDRVDLVGGEAAK